LPSGFRRRRIQSMQQRIPGFRGEFLWELDVPEIQLLALAEAVPAETYAWRPAEGARSLSEVLVHVAAGNFLLMKLAGIAVPGGFDLFGPVEGDPLTQLAAIVHRSRSLEKTVVEKSAVVELLRRSIEAVRQSFTEASNEELERTGEYFGEQTTVRRVYMRMLAHMHEHMGQAVAYARAAGIRVPWPDPLDELKRQTEDAGR
jgi:uncharacterized damage-inducible protein DinB